MCSRSESYHAVLVGVGVFHGEVGPNGRPVTLPAGAVLGRTVAAVVVGEAVVGGVGGVVVAAGGAVPEFVVVGNVVGSNVVGTTAVTPPPATGTVCVGAAGGQLR